METQKPLIYDLPTRLFHWSFAGLFVGAFFIVNIFDDESAIFPYHMMMGLALAFIVSLRIIWGIFGTKYARFSSYVLNPVALIDYLKGVISGKATRKLGRNPASSWAALVMIFLSIGLAVTGFLMTSGNGSHDLEEAHELFANTFIIVAILHVAGIVLHTLRHKESIGYSMIHGYKEPVDGDNTGIGGHHVAVGLLFVLLIASFVFFLGKNYNPEQQRLNLFGTYLELHEMEEEEGKHRQEHKTEQGYESHNDHDDD